MYSSFIKNLPQKPNSFENFMVKGLKVPPCELDSPLSQLIGNYFTEKENIAVFTSSSQEKLEAIKEITSKLLSKFAIITDKANYNSIMSIISSPVFLISEFTHFNDFDYLIFYNVKVPSKIENIHISCFYTFKGLYNPENYKEYISNFMGNFPTDLITTIISKYPNMKKVEFIFGTSEEIKYLSIPQNETGLIFFKIPLLPSAEKYFASSNLASELSESLNTSKLIFYDLDASLVPFVLDRIDHVVFIYTKSDFPVLSEIVKIVQEKGLDIPDSIKKLTSFNTLD